MSRATKTSLSGLLWESFRYHFLEKKMNSWLGYFLMTLIAVATTYVVADIDYRIGFVFVGVCICILIVIAFFKYPYFALYFTIAFSAIYVFLVRLTDFPFGFFIDPMTVLLVLSTLIRYDLRRQIDKEFWLNPISLSLYILFAYTLIEMFNPEMSSMLGWISYFRKEITYFLVYLTCYCLFNSKKHIVSFIYFTIILTTAMAIYACKQQWFGYFNFEIRSIMRGGPIAFQLLYQGGLLRKFSTLTDPATSGILFAATSLQTLVLLVRDSDKKRKIWWAIAAVFNLLAYSFSGTRTATLMIVAGIGFYALTTLYEKRTLVFLMACVIGFYALLVMPIHNPVTARIRTSFEVSSDASAQLRDYDRHQIQPYLFEHPLGGGIFTSGAEGPKYNPSHPLVSFQPDSGYAKMLAEQGSIGLALLLLTYFIQMRQGLKNFYRARDPEVQNHYIALLVMVFSIMCGQYAQMAISQYPILLYYYAFLVVFIKLIAYENPEYISENIQTR